MIFSMFSVVANAQNLLRNPSFERVDTNAREKCSINFKYVDVLSDWRGVNTVDFATISEPFTIHSGQPKVRPFSGSSMAGVYLIDMGDDQVPEYLFQRLEFPLVANVPHHFNVHIHFRNLDGYFPKKIQFKLTQQDPCGKSPQNLEGQVFSIPSDLPTVNDDAWLAFSLDFTPDKPYTFIIMGSFDNLPDVKNKHKRGLGAGIYAFIDDVELTNNLPTVILANPVIDSIIPNAGAPQLKDSVSIGTTTLEERFRGYSAIPSISFEHNSYEIPPMFTKLLDALIPVLISKGCALIISGHTDNTGDAEKNDLLSQKRAQSVADFFISHGFDKSKIVIKTYGSTKPVAVGDDELSLSMNRRVEIEQQCQ